MPRVVLFGNSRVTPRSGVSPNSVRRCYRVGVDDSVEGTALLREGVKKLIKMLIHFTMVCTGNVGIPELDLTCLRELKTVGGYNAASTACNGDTFPSSVLPLQIPLRDELSRASSPSQPHVPLFRDAGGLQRAFVLFSSLCLCAASNLRRCSSSSSKA